MHIHVSDHEGGVRLLRINRPPANAINVELLQELHDVVSAAEADESVRAVVVTGAGRFFSAGLDIKEMAQKGVGELARLGGGKDGIYKLWRLPKPTIAMVDGHALAGGAILMLACDFRIASRGAFKIGVTETALGLPLPNGAFQIARYAIPSKYARRVLLEADSFDPMGALEVGLVDHLTSQEELEARSFAMARKLGAYPTAAYAFQKYLLQAEANQAVHSPVDPGNEAFRKELMDSFEKLAAARKGG
ncbi:MAG TPA: enoyl-CoA hydratase/isomerase family protein [Candidatus Binatia bacterium]